MKTESSRWTVRQTGHAAAGLTGRVGESTTPLSRIASSQAADRHPGGEVVLVFVTPPVDWVENGVAPDRLVATA